MSNEDAIPPPQKPEFAPSAGASGEDPARGVETAEAARGAGCGPASSCEGREGKRPLAPETEENVKRLRANAECMHAGASPEDCPVPPEALQSFSPLGTSQVVAGAVLHAAPDVAPADLARRTSPMGEEDDAERGENGVTRDDRGNAGGGTTGAALNRKGENKPVEIAPNVARLPPYDKNVTSSILVSTATFATVSVPSEDFREQLASPPADGVKGEETAKGGDGAPGTGAGVRADRPPVPLDEEKLREREEEAWRQAQQQEGRGPYKLPSCTFWFDETKLATVERDLLPSLFVDSGLPAAELEERYLQLRQAVVSLYRADPTKYLSFSECRRVIAADAALLLRLHSFLDYWGVINFQADPATIPSAVTRRRDILLKDIQTLQKRGEASQVSGEKGEYPNQLLSALTSLSGVGDEGAAAGGAGPWRCAACGKVCLYSYYVLRPGGSRGVSLGVLDKCVWCLKCFADGRYPPVLTERQFLKVSLPLMGSDGSDGKWTLEETERLIEGIERHLNDWNEVAAFVGGGRTAQMCVERFIQLPIQEPLLPPRGGGADAGPFRHFKNPLLSLLAFLASSVHPSVAAAAARAALKATVDLLGDEETPARGEREAAPEQRETPAEREAAPEASGKRRENGEKTPRVTGTKNEAESAQEKTGKEERREGEKDEDRAKRERRPWLANSENRGLIGDCDLQVACATAVAAGAAAARELAKVEEKEVKEIMSEVVKLQLEKLELRMNKMQVLQTRIAQSKAAMETKFSQLLNEHRDLAAELVKTKEAALTALP
ncbi:SWIRM domain-containing protein [Toxoplasma gondii GAB2-2007-GAL-DOM2]|uniref:SWI/SNF complex subunit SWI3 n=5 Tax=Toxoplasma gondii TaxID=5811 RepID=B9QG90_TOXGV|nr:SWIRM domain-containing protein [Toxoplasma gondii VEG]KFG40168.1 SWIRM domain-containing protein [Toxoplasma gondii GAB2-2007-GAL-DOM2]CEL72877.1 TPA: SWI/SNF complex subunit SWI3 [Toxoplasma gondii VEG]